MKTFLQLIKVLISLLGVFVVSFSMNIDMYHGVVLASYNLVLIETLYDVVNVGIFLLLYAYIFLSCCHKCLPKMLKRMWIRAVFTTTSALSMLLIVSIGSEHNTSEDKVPC